ncbi:MAG: 5-formyltetrahydrofolate cyclo-ligase [Proteobacteria bacterium]|nr:5-formyltetrahydrofolate cyclo-ligase [Pseudomonadota bacterium]
MVESEISSLDELKRELRKKAKLRRAEAAAAGDPEVAAYALCERVIGAQTFSRGCPEGCVVSAYWPIGSEVDPRPLMHRLHEDGHPIALPVVVARGRPLVFRAWRSGDPLEPAGLGTREPLADRPELTPRVLIVPLLAFDRAGYRLGYGGGFYDRTLTGLRRAGETLAVGVAYAAQEVAEVPHDGDDQPLDWLVTEAEAIEIGPKIGSKAE